MRKTAFILTAVLLVGAVMSGCAKTEKVSDEGAKLKLWSPLQPVVSYSYKNLGDTPLFMEIEKRLGIDLEFEHPTQGQEKEQFNLLIASKELPDIFFFTHPDIYKFKGGVPQAVEEGVVLGLDDYINEEKAPNITKIIKENPEVERSMKLDDGTYFGFPSGGLDRFLRSWRGLIVRKDWLDKVGLEIPETVDEWEVALTAFKNELGATAPYTLLGTNEFAAAYNAPKNFYYDVDEKAINYGPNKPEYRGFVERMRKWYELGLLDSEFATHNATIADAKITSGASGVISTGAASGINKYYAAMSDIEGVEWAGAPFPVLNKGEKAKYGQISEKSVVTNYVTSACKDVDTAIRFLDYGYGEEGHMIYNFGIEGESYNMVDGYPKYTEDMTDNPDGIPMSNQLAKYVMTVYGGPFFQDKRYFEQYLKLDEQKQAVSMWETAENSHVMPSLILTSEESEAIETPLNDIQTYWVECEYKLIMGQMDMSEYDVCVEKIRQMGLDTVLKVYNDAYTRMMNR